MSPSPPAPARTLYTLLGTGAGSSRVLIISLDGGTWTVLQPAFESGSMPRLAHLAAGGRSGVLESVVPAITPAAWCSFQTGLDPGGTGIADFTRWDRTTGREVPVDTRRLPETLWEAAGRAGRRVGVVNLPMTWPPRAVNGFLVPGLLTPSTEGVFTHPPELGPELLAAVPGYHIFHLETAVDEADRESLEAFIDFAAWTVTSRGAAARWLLDRHPVELLMVHFQATDIVQHVLWHYLDPDHERFDPVKQHLILDRFYGALDRAVGSVLDAFTAQDQALRNRVPPTTLVISDHGFQRHGKRFNLWRWLAAEGWLVPALDGRLAGDGGVGDGPAADLTASHAVSTGRSNEAFIWLLEADPADRHRTAGALIAALEAVRDPLDGERLIRKVYRREELWSGPRLAELPDLVVVPEGPVSITGRFEPDAPLVSRVEPGADFHAGRHHPDGIFIAAGPGIPSEGVRRSRRPVDMPRARLVDVAPAVLALLGVGTGEGRPGPSGEGRDESAGADLAGEVYTPEERAIIEKRLRDLGY